MELLIRVVDRPTEKGIAREKQLQRGDVVAAMPDGHKWSRRERENPHWRILALPGLTKAEADALLAPENAIDGQRELLQKRRQTLDIDAFPTRIKTALTDASRAVAVQEVTSPTELTAVRAAAKLRQIAEPIVDEPVRVR